MLSLTYKHRRSLLRALGGLVILMLCGPLRAEGTAAAIPDFAALPESVQKAVSLGQPRSSGQIAESPFGTISVVCFDGKTPGSGADYARAIAEAGYKWVGEYMQADWSPRPTSADTGSSWMRASPACTEHLARLQAHQIRILMRVDPLPTPKLIGSMETTPEELAFAKAYLRSVVSQLKPYVRHWQLGNEPNVANAPEAYVKIFAELARVVRSEQPDAVIYGPGLAMLQSLADQPFPWLAHALRANLLSHLDVFSFHPYRANGDPPESASEFARWRRWKNYPSQLDALGQALRAAAGRRSARLAVTEDGEASPISATGEQRVTGVIAAKHELRRSLLDFAQGISPRLHFVFFRRMPDVTYNYQGSFNTVSATLDKKPLYYAAQNLHAVLDSSYDKTNEVRVSVIDRNTRDAPQVGSQVQTYLKHQAGFDELLVFFWAPVFAQNMHLRVPVCLLLSDASWQAPVLVDLMTMPGAARSQGHKPSDHKRASYPTAKRTEKGLLLDALELRDYPQVLKLIRVTERTQISAAPAASAARPPASAARR